MTITYQGSVATGSISGFTKLLFKWRGSVYKLVYKELLLFSFGYAIISVIYRTALSETRKRVFEQVSLFCAHYIDLIPLSFVLGFYVTTIVQRWWTQFTTIPFPDKLMNTVTLYVSGNDERGRLIRRTLMRWWNLSFVLMMRTISVAVKKRFPAEQHLVEAGFMTQEELELYDSIHTKINKFWIPMNWFIKLVDQTRIEGRTREGAALKHILEELNLFRNSLRLLWCHDWVTIPLVYTQVVTWATHLFFLVSLIGRQYLDPSMKYDGHEVDLYIPFFTLMQFLFYMGWLKVAEQLINPFGEDDDDIECNWLIDRHLQISYLGVDELYNKVPSLQKDIYWNTKQPNLPYNAASLVHKIPSYRGSTSHVKVNLKDQALFHDLKYQSSISVNTENLEKPSCWQKFTKLFKRKSNENANNGNGSGFYGYKGDKNPLSQRTLGRRETLLGDEILAMLNGGQWNYQFFKHRLSRHFENSLNPQGNDDCVVDIEEPSEIPPFAETPLTKVGRSSFHKVGRFLVKRSNSITSVLSLQSQKSGDKQQFYVENTTNGMHHLQVPVEIPNINSVDNYAEATVTEVTDDALSR
ncbi:hypothetical protein CHUAL_003926 [Chamberlinius hualienensis]